jgi:flagellar motor switch protein FliN/FliY
MQDPNKQHENVEHLKHAEEYLLDIPLRVTIELGRRTMRVREILQLKQDSVLDLPKSAGENLDVYVNGRLVAYGEVLEMEARTGIRLTDLHTIG